MSPRDLLTSIDERLKCLEILYDRDEFETRLQKIEERLDDAEGMIDFASDELMEMEKRIEDVELDDLRAHDEDINDLSDRIDKLEAKIDGLTEVSAKLTETIKMICEKAVFVSP